MSSRPWNLHTFDDLAWFWAKVDKSAGDGCWLWTGTIEVNGYGVTSVSNEMFKAHVIAWQLVNGPKPAERVLDHLCRVRHCVNVAHLELVDHRTNVLRGVGPTAVNAVKDSCDNGHVFDAENTYWRGNGNRDCRACRRARSLAWYYRRKAA